MEVDPGREHSAQSFHFPFYCRLSMKFVDVWIRSNGTCTFYLRRTNFPTPESPLTTALLTPRLNLSHWVRGSLFFTPVVTETTRLQSSNQSLSLSQTWPHARPFMSFQCLASLVLPCSAFHVSVCLHFHVQPHGLGFSGFLS